MRGVGGPLLTIGDLLSDVGEESGAAPLEHLPPPPSPSSLDLQSLDLTRLFQEDYDKLDKASAGSDHSWTGLTLKLCTALETANKLVKSTDTNAGVLLEKVAQMPKFISFNFYLKERRKLAIIITDSFVQNLLNCLANSLSVQGKQNAP